MALLDNYKRLILFKGQAQVYEKMSTIKIKPAPVNGTTIRYQILDAVLIQTFKLLTFVEITSTDKPHKENPKHNHQCN